MKNSNNPTIRAGWNKVRTGNFVKINKKVQDGIRECRMYFSQKIINCASQVDIGKKNIAIFHIYNDLQR